MSLLLLIFPGGRIDSVGAKLGDEFKLRVARARPSEVLNGPALVAFVVAELATRAEVLVRLATVKVVLVELSTDT